MKLNYIFLILLILNTLHAKELENVTLQLKWFHSFQFAGYYMAKEKGFYKESALNVKIQELKPNQNLVKDVIKNNVNYAIADSGILVNRLEGKPIVALMALFQHSPLVLLTKKSSNIIDPIQLRNKRVMLESEGTHDASIIAMLKESGVELSDLKIKKYSYDINDLIEDRVDAMSAYLSYEPYFLKAKGIEYNVINPINYGVDFYGDVLFTSEDEVKNHPKRVDKFLIASKKGWLYALENIDETIDIIIKKYNPSGDKKALEFEAKEMKKLILPNLIEIGKINPLRFERIANIYKEQKLIDTTSTIDGFIYKKDKKLEFTKEEREFLKKHPIIKVGIDTDWPPFEFIDENSKYLGIASEYMKIVEERIGIKFKIEKKFKWNEVVEKMKKRELDIYSCAVATQQRKEYMNFTTHYISFPMVIITSDKVNFINDIDELKNKKIAVAKGYATYEILTKKHPYLKFTLTNSVEEGLELVAYDKAYAFIGNIATVSYFIKKDGFTNLKVAGKTPYNFELSMGARSDWPLLKEILQKALNSIDNDDKNEIYRKWINLKYEVGFDYSLFWKAFLFITIIISFIIYWNRRLSHEVNLRKESEARYRVFSDVSFEAIVVLKDGKIIDANKATAEIFGYSLENMKGKLATTFVAKEYKDIVANNIKTLSEEPYEAYLINRDKVTFPAELRAKMIEINGESLRVTAIRNVSDRVEKEKILQELNIKLENRVEDETKKRIEKEKLLIQQSKMASMGEMIGNIAHQWRQPLNALGLILQKIKLAKDRDKLSNELIDESSQKGMFLIQKMSTTIDDFRNFFKPDKEMKLFNLKSNILNSFEIIESSFKSHNIKVVLQIDENLELLGYPNEFSQVILNIFTNAKDEFIEKNVKSPKILINAHNKIDSVYISILDNAGGIKKDIIDKIFEPYFSTKDENKGTGLGLYMSKMIIEQNMRGKLSVKNENKGAKFIIELPIKK